MIDDKGMNGLMEKDKLVKRILLVLIILLAIVFRVWASQPTWIHLDENYYINMFQNYVDRGELTPYMWRIGGDTNIIGGGGTGYGIFLLFGWMKVFGETLISMRILMILAGLITTWVYYLISKKWWGSEEAGIAALVFGLVSTSAFFSLIGNMYSLAILSYSLLLLLHITAVRQEKKLPHFWVGVLAILTTEFHMMGLLYLGALGFYYGIKYLEIIKNERRLILNVYPMYFFFGAGLMGLVYIIVHIMPDPKAYFIISSTCPFCFPSRIKTEILRFVFMLMYRPHELILTLFVLYFTIRHRNENQHFLLLFLGYFLSQIVFHPQPNVQYYHHLVPLVSIGFARMVTYAIERVRAEQQPFLKNVLLVASLVILSLNPALLFYSKWQPFEFAHSMPDTAEIDYIKANIPKTTVVMSVVKNFYPLKEYRNFLQFATNLNYGLSIRGEKMGDFLNRVNPEVVYLPPEDIEENQTLHQFLDSKDFEQVMPDLWVVKGLIPDE